MTMRPCLQCGVPSEASRCAEHTRERARTTKGSAKQRGYGYAWDKLSRRARRLQPFCEVCGSPDDLQTDHTPEAWARKAAGKSIRLRDVRVLCGFHNREAGAARGPQTRGVPPSGTAPRPEVVAKFASHLPYVIENVAGTGRGWRVDLLSDSEPVAGRVGDGDPLLSVEHPQHSTSLNLVGGVPLVTAGMVVALRTQYLKVHPRSLS